MDFTYENSAYAKGFAAVCGIDEAGRGPLAGPVCAGAVILPRDYEHPILNDSKKLTEKRREEVYEDIIKDAAAWAVGFATEQEIDRINIVNATFLAMKRAVEGLSILPDFAYIDGNLYPHTGVVEQTLIKGDALCMSVAAASIVAKVSRDRLMLELSEKYPEYRFEKHKGYGTALHYEMLEMYGVSPVHRRTFLKGLNLKEYTPEKQVV